MIQAREVGCSLVFKHYDMSLALFPVFVRWIGLRERAIDIWSPAVGGAIQEISGFKAFTRA